MQWSLLKEREKIRVELEKDAAQDRESAREIFNELRTQLESEVATLQQSLNQEQRQSQQVSAVLISEKIRHEDELATLQGELAAIRKTIGDLGGQELAAALEAQHQRIASIRARARTHARPDAQSNA